MSSTIKAGELSSLKEGRLWGLVKALHSSKVNFIDTKTKFKGWFAPVGKGDIEAGMEAGILSKSGMRWKVNTAKVEKLYKSKMLR